MSNQKSGLVFYVSPRGNDSWSGGFPVVNEDSTDGPFATLSRARDAVRETNAGENEAARRVPVTVLMRGGTYVLDETVVFGVEDSGVRESPITYAAYVGETPNVSGGTTLEGEWKPYDEKIMMLSLEFEGSFRQLTANGKRKKRARTPNAGFFQTESVQNGTSFTYVDGDMSSYKNIEDAEIVMLHSWNQSRLRIESLDEETRTVVCKDPKAMHEIGWTGSRGQNNYYIENTLEGLDEPGEWYHDGQSRTLYYWPEDGEDVKSAEFVVPRLGELIRFEGDIDGGQFAQYVRFEGITFSDTDWELADNGYPDCGDVGDIVDPATVTFQAARYCEIRKCTIKNTGTYALDINGYGNIVEDNEIYDTGSGGIVTRNFHTEHNIFRYNYIHDCCHAYPSGVGINIDEGGGTFVHNLIHEIGHSGIYARHWGTDSQAIERRNQEQELRIEYNEIYDCSTIVDDAGGIFIRDANIIIRNNLIHDIHSGQKRCPGWGIYLGCETRDTLVENNLVYNCLESLHVWYYDRNITVTNNIFVDAEWCHINFGNPQHLSHENIRIIGNVMYCTKMKGHLFSVFGKRSLPVASDYNVIFSAVNCVLNNPVIEKLEGVTTFDEWRELGLDEHTITANPSFVDLAHNDYTLKPNSPAFKLGFRQIDFSNVGLRGRNSAD
jgi:hypothetical protein